MLATCAMLSADVGPWQIDLLGVHRFALLGAMVSSRLMPECIGDGSRVPVASAVWGTATALTRPSLLKYKA